MVLVYENKLVLIREPLSLSLSPSPKRERVSSQAVTFIFIIVYWTYIIHIHTSHRKNTRPNASQRPTEKHGAKEHQSGNLTWPFIVPVVCLHKDLLTTAVAVASDLLHGKTHLPLNQDNLVELLCTVPAQGSMSLLCSLPIWRFDTSI